MIDCHCIRKSDNACMHYMAPKLFLGRRTICILIDTSDLRHTGCALQYPLTKDGKPTFPPSTLGDDELKVPPLQR